MTRSKWLASLVVFGLLLLGGALYLFSRREGDAARVEAVVSAAAPVAKPNAPAPATSAQAQVFRNGVPLKRVMELYDSESQRVGKIDPDPKATQKRLEEDARVLTPEEIDWLEGQAINAKNDADARFFAAYLLGLSHEEAAVGPLSQLALAPLPKSKNDRFVEQERAFRASAVEGLSHSCADFPGPVKDALLNVVANQPDEFVRDRAHRGLYACQTGKSIEQQDTEALEKLRAGGR